MQVLLDTHALLWAAFEPDKLSHPARAALVSRGTEIFVSAASAWEVTTKARIGKLRGADEFCAQFVKAVERLGFRQLAISVDHAQRAGSLPGGHKDPFDRMLIAQAMAENIPIVSNELIFDRYHLRRIW